MSTPTTHESISPAADALDVFHVFRAQPEQHASLDSNKDDACSTSSTSLLSAEGTISRDHLAQLAASSTQCSSTTKTNDLRRRYTRVLPFAADSETALQQLLETNAVACVPSPSLTVVNREALAERLSAERSKVAKEVREARQKARIDADAKVIQASETIEKDRKMIASLLTQILEQEHKNMTLAVHDLLTVDPAEKSVDELRVLVAQTKQSVAKALISERARYQALFRSSFFQGEESSQPPPSAAGPPTGAAAAVTVDVSSSSSTGTSTGRIPEEETNTKR
mmetsp:Transcript_41560/g.104813  ORF Transcript_41560/g.104813 Transcript_41560/m.104813 type:complete len:282 (-) Transcript_41560:51-896(-)|eukprot:CAMPEP_0174230596 /NCGR_PEP_ID=MMETSP0417-20130205/1336_1 /TAXON_ID=242541 /ORGANISM="Mayorella sp, Strain BSH-02190019" /LENGTH=281 /DNA_ID=CAMNT_0015308319 /DNA_START=41 /DNA_END=886 /DNA_ORIENTATION=+